MWKKEKRSKRFTLRFTEGEFAKLEGLYKKSSSNQLSHYMRNVALGKPVVIKYRNQSLDGFMEELLTMKQELNAMGNNLNQAVKKLHTLKQIPEFRVWIASYEALQSQVEKRTEHIEARIAQMSDKWLQE